MEVGHGYARLYKYVCELKHLLTPVYVYHMRKTKTEEINNKKEGAAAIQSGDKYTLDRNF